MSNNTPNAPAFLEIKVHLDPNAYEILKSDVFARLEALYGKPLPEIVYKRISEELTITHDFAYAQSYLAHRNIVRSLSELDYPFLIVSHNGASLIEYVLGVTQVNPLQPHYRCDSCGYTESVSPDLYETGFDLPEKHCPNCGGKLIGDGQNLHIESFIGLRYDHCPHLAFGVPATKFEESIAYMETRFDAKQQDINDHTYHSDEDGYRFVDISILPINNLPTDKPAVPVKGVEHFDDPEVFAFLSTPESCDCYLPYEQDIPLVKELLEAVKVNDFSDIFKLCGLIHSSQWLPYILPSILNGTIDFRRTITAREDIYRYLVNCGIDHETSFRVMDRTRKGRASELIKDESLLKLLLSHGVSESYIADLKNIRFLTTRAMTIELAMTVYRNARLRMSQPSAY